MKKLIESFALHLANERGRTKETIVKYCGNLNILFTRMRVKSTQELQEGILNRRLLDDFWLDIQTSRKPLSDQTRANYLSALKAFLKFCFQYDLIEKDIAHKIQIPKKKLVYLEGLTTKEKKQLREYLPRNTQTVKDLRDTALVMFLWGTGCRISEALNLNVHPDGYIYFHDEKVISGSFMMADNKMYVHFEGKGKKDRRVRVSDDIIAYLNLYLKERKDKNKTLFMNTKNGRSNTRRLTRDGAIFIVNKVLDNSGARKEPGLATHVFRHTAINTWLEQKVSLADISIMTGDKPETIMTYYADRNKKLTDLFGEKFKSTGEIEDPILAEYEKAVKMRHSLYGK